MKYKCGDKVLSRYSWDQWRMALIVDVREVDLDLLLAQDLPPDTVSYDVVFGNGERRVVLEEYVR